MRRHPVRWKTRFASFVGDYTVAALSRDLGVTNQSVYGWVAGRAAPRLSTAQKIIELSEQRGQKLELRDLSGQAQEVGDGAGEARTR